MVLPDGTVVPPIPYLVGLVIAALAIGGTLVRQRPPVTSSTVLALAPWMACGGALHVLAVGGIAAPAARPLLESPAVYLTTAILAGIAWLVAVRDPLDLSVPRPVPWVLGSLGLAGVGIVSLAIGRAALARGDPALAWPLAGLVGSAILTAVVWAGMRYITPTVTATTDRVGGLVVFAHAFDAVTTAVGADVLGFGERSPVPRMIMEVAGTLPAAEVLGVGWAFVLVKLALAVTIIWLFTDFVRESPTQAYLLLAAVAAVGLGPATHNFLLFILLG